MESQNPNMEEYPQESQYIGNIPDEQNEYPVDIKNSSDYSQPNEEDEYINEQMWIGFIRKVFGILFAQLSFTFFCVLLFQLNIIKNFVIKNEKLSLFFILFSAISFMIIYFILICNRKLGRTVPYNYIILSLITFFETVICASTAMAFSIDIVLISLFLTIISAGSIIIYAFKTKKDFSNLSLLLFMLMSQLIAVGILRIFIRNEFVKVFYCLFGTVIVGMYLVYDVQLISGKVGLVYEVDDYIFAALELYIDIIRLFLEILRIVAKVMNKRN